MISKAQVVQILRDPDVLKINFLTKAGRVSGAGFARIATLIDDGRISFATVSTIGEQCLYAPVGDVNSHGAAVLSDTMYVSSLLQPQDMLAKSLIIHEATHAMQDRHGMQMSTVVAEVAAYIAQGFYLAAKGLDTDRVSELTMLDGVSNSLIQNGFGIAHGLMNEPGGYQVDPAAQQFLADELRAHPDYRAHAARIVQFNGIRP